VATLERGAVVPAFEERLHEIGDGRTVNLGVCVMPRWSRAERGVEDLSLRVAFMTLVVATSVAEVDATDEGDILVGAAGMAVAALPRSSAERNHSEAPCIKEA
jgi:hypothetical protein